MYDHLVVPIPPKRDSNDERKTIDAEREWKRWKENAWNPARLTQLLAILGDIAVPVEWTAPRRRAWRRAYEREKQAPHVATADHIAKELAFQVTGERLLDVVPAMAKGVVAVAPYTSLAELKKDLGITQRPLTGDHLEAAPRLPGSVLSAVLGGEFFVPDDPDKDDFYLLSEAVDVARSSDFREARMALHDVQQQFLRKGSTDPVSVEAAVKAMNDHLQDLARLVRKRRIWTGVKHAFFFGQLGVDIVLGPLNPAAFGKAAISLGQFSASMMLPDPNRPEQVRAGGALLLVAQDRLGLTVSGERRPRRSRPRR